MHKGEIWLLAQTTTTTILIKTPRLFLAFWITFSVCYCPIFFFLFSYISKAGYACAHVKYIPQDSLVFQLLSDCSRLLGPLIFLHLGSEKWRKKKQKRLEEVREDGEEQNPAHLEDSFPLQRRPIRWVSHPSAGVREDKECTRKKNKTRPWRRGSDHSQFSFSGGGTSWSSLL